MGFVRTGGFYGRFQPAGAELKYLDTEINLGTVGDSIIYSGNLPNTGQLCNVSQGTGPNQRIGRKITIKSISGQIGMQRLVDSKGLVPEQPQDGKWTSGQAFVWLVLDKQCNGTPAAVADIFTFGYTYQSIRNLQYSDRFQILAKWSWDMTAIYAYGQADAGNNFYINDITRTVDIYKKCNIPIEYSGSTGGLTEIRSNNIFLCWGTQGYVNNEQGDNTAFIGSIRIRYSDS
jgi:hypothetical protein